jgi:hypothetical protein
MALTSTRQFVLIARENGCVHLEKLNAAPKLVVVPPVARGKKIQF